MSSLLITGSHFFGPDVKVFSDHLYVVPVLSKGEGPVVHAVFLHGGVSRLVVRHVALDFSSILLENDFLMEVFVQVSSGFAELSISDGTGEADVVNETVLTDQFAETNTTSVRYNLALLLGGHEHNRHDFTGTSRHSTGINLAEINGVFLKELLEDDLVLSNFSSSDSAVTRVLFLR
jgi:hypothetical protein